MSINTYDKGDVVRCSGVFTNAAGTAIDPSVIKFEVLPPGASSPTIYTYGTDAQLVRSGTGAYYVDVDADSQGDYRWRLYSTGTGKAAADGHFNVQQTFF